MPDRIDKWYSGFAATAMNAAEGNLQQADYFTNCTVAQYYWRLKVRKDYVTAHNERLKKG